jgi:hypothetical protein
MCDNLIKIKEGIGFPAELRKALLFDILAPEVLRKIESISDSTLYRDNVDLKTKALSHYATLKKMSKSQADKIKQMNKIEKKERKTRAAHKLYFLLVGSAYEFWEKAWKEQNSHSLLIKPIQENYLLQDDLLKHMKCFDSWRSFLLPIAFTKSVLNLGAALSKKLKQAQIAKECSERFIKNIAKLENAGRNQILEDFKKRSAQINESPLCIDISSDIWTIFLEIWEQGMSSFSFWMQLATITLFLVLKLLCSVSPIFGLEIEMPPIVVLINSGMEIAVPEKMEEDNEKA